MSKIPLRKYAEMEFPMTPKSTLHSWAKRAHKHHEGPLAGIIERVGGRWYVKVGDPTTDKIVADVKTLLESAKSEMMKDRQGSQI